MSPITRPAHGDRLVIIGNRIIESDQIDPPPGSGWVRRFSDLLIAADPARRVEIIDRTADGQTLHEIRNRWDDDVGWFRPQWIVVVLGLADTWQLIDGKPDHYEPAAFAEALTDLLRHHRSAHGDARLVLVDQPFLSLNTDPLWGTGRVLARLGEFHAALERVAAEVGAIHIPAQARFTADLKAEGALRYGGGEGNGDQDASLVLADHVATAIDHPAPFTSGRLSPGQRVVFMGDSITDAGRRGPQHRPFGTGYLRVWRGLLQARDPDLTRSLTIVNSGIGGNNAANLLARWDADCLAHAPDHLVVKIGINDCNQTLSKRPEPVTAERYETMLDEAIRRTRAAFPDVRLTFLTPFFLSRASHGLSYRWRVLDYLPQYHAALARLGGRHGATVVDLHARFQIHLDHRPAAAFGGRQGMDAVHPSETGCMVIAEALYAALH